MTALAVEEATVVPITKGKRKRGMSREEMDGKYPSLKTLAGPPSKASERAWVAAFTLKPEAMEELIRDLIKQQYATPGRIGQRPMPKEEEVNLHAMLHGEYTDEPLVAVLPGLMRVSQRMFAQRIFMGRTQFQRLLDGTYEPTMEEIALIAKVVKKPASFFLEYRIMAAQAAFITMIQERPGVATRLYRDYLSVNAPRTSKN